MIKARLSTSVTNDEVMRVFPAGRGGGRDGKDMLHSLADTRQILNRKLARVIDGPRKAMLDN